MLDYLFQVRPALLLSFLLVAAPLVSCQQDIGELLDEAKVESKTDLPDTKIEEKNVTESVKVQGIYFSNWKLHIIRILDWPTSFKAFLTFTYQSDKVWFWIFNHASFEMIWHLILIYATVFAHIEIKIIFDCWILIFAKTTCIILASGHCFCSSTCIFSRLDWPLDEAIQVSPLLILYKRILSRNLPWINCRSCKLFARLHFWEIQKSWNESWLRLEICHIYFNLKSCLKEVTRSLGRRCRLGLYS